MSYRLAGFKPWALQRLTGLYIAVFIIIAAVLALSYGWPRDYAQWADLVARPDVNLALLALFAALLYHAWVGIRDVILDYVHPTPLRFAALSIFGTGLIVCGLWAARMLLLAMA